MRVWDEENDSVLVQELRGRDGIKLKKELFGRKEEVTLTEEDLGKVFTKFDLDPRDLNYVKPYTLGIPGGEIRFTPINDSSYPGPARIFEAKFFADDSYSRKGFISYIRGFIRKSR